MGSALALPGVAPTSDAVLPPLRFTLDQAGAEADAWRFSCGPAAICALLGMAPLDVRPYLLGFRGWMNPTQMRAALRALRVSFVVEQETTARPLDFPRFGIARIQWGGPWMVPGVPFGARYRHTHWVASTALADDARAIFDVNAITVGGWIPSDEWATRLVPFILEDTPRADGTWTITHAIEVRR